MQNRAYSVLQVKGLDEGARKITGMATTPTVDRVGDIIEPKGVKFDNPLALLWQHEHDQPIGHVTFKPATDKGIEFEAELIHPDAVESSILKERLQLAWDSFKTKLVRAVSIGFRPLEYAFMDNGGVRYMETEVYELSAVTIPANADAIISTVKSIDAALRKDAGIPDPEIPQRDTQAETGKGRVVKLDAPARSRAEPFVIRKIKRT